MLQAVQSAPFKLCSVYALDQTDNWLWLNPSSWQEARTFPQFAAAETLIHSTVKNGPTLCVIFVAILKSYKKHVLYLHAWPSFKDTVKVP